MACFAMTFSRFRAKTLLSWRVAKKQDARERRQERVDWVRWRGRHSRWSDEGRFPFQPISKTVTYNGLVASIENVVFYEGKP